MFMRVRVIEYAFLSFSIGFGTVLYVLFFNLCLRLEIQLNSVSDFEADIFLFHFRSPLRITGVKS